MDDDNQKIKLKVHQVFKVYKDQSPNNFTNFINFQLYKLTMPHTGKTNKSFLKRIKITGRGKLMKRPPGQNHFNAKDSGDASRRKKGHKMTPKELIRSAKALLPSNIKKMM